MLNARSLQPWFEDKVLVNQSFTLPCTSVYKTFTRIIFDFSYVNLGGFISSEELQNDTKINFARHLFPGVMAKSNT